MTQEEREKVVRRIPQHHLEDADEDNPDHDDVSIEEVWAIANNTG